MKNRMSILIDSFDGYADIWPYFFQTLDKYWSVRKYPVMIASNYKECEYAQTILTGIEKSWIERTRIALERINSDYVMLLLEDYFLSKIIFDETIEKYLDYIEKNEVVYLRLVENPKSKIKNSISEFVPILENEEYGINLQASIWNKNHLLSILKNIGKGSAWDFEIEFLKKAVNGNNNIINGCYTLQNNPLGFHNAVLKGKWFPKEIRYYRKRGILINTESREKLSYIESFKYEIRIKVKSFVPYKTRRIIKKMLIKIGVKFVSNL